MLTKRGIELNLKESNYVYDTNEDLKLYFSSNFNLGRFTLNIDDFIKEETIKMKNKYKLNISMNKFLIVSFYKRIEKRGFYIVNTKTNKEIPENTMFIIN